ncbi:hypothetical protein BH10ACT6_BH10ACT6_03920 [soil metagenome]
MIEPQRTPLAWVESPLQLLCAAEYAARLGRPIAVALRLTGDQMPVTAQELLDRGALFSAVTPYFGIPWGPLRAQPDWVIGDGFSGQFRMAAAALRPRTITLVDDGDMSRHLAAALLGRTGFARPGARERGLTAALGGVTRERLLRLAASERVTMFSAFAHDPAVAALAARDVAVETNEFAWLRAHPRAVELPHPRVVLGSANVTDGLLDESNYLGWLRAVAALAPVSYLPHRREARAAVARVAQLPGVVVVDSGMPAELALAGTTRPLEIVSMPSSAATTLRRVLEGTGSTVRVSAPGLNPVAAQGVAG